MLREGSYGINGSFGSRAKKFSFNFTEANTNFWWNFHYNADDSLFINLKEVFKSEVKHKKLNFPTSITNGFSATESREVSLNGNVYEFLVDYSSVNKSDIINILEYLTTKSKIK